MRATYRRPHGTEQFVGCYDVHADCPNGPSPSGPPPVQGLQRVYRRTRRDWIFPLDSAPATVATTAPPGSLIVIEKVSSPRPRSPASTALATKVWPATPFQSPVPPNTTVSTVGCGSRPGLIVGSSEKATKLIALATNRLRRGRPSAST